MAKIFVKAHKVLVYLGEPDDSTLQALEQMDKIFVAALDSPKNDGRPAIE